MKSKFSVHYLTLKSLSRGAQMPRDKGRCQQTEYRDHACHHTRCPESGHPRVTQVVGAGAHLRSSVL